MVIDAACARRPEPGQAGYVLPLTLGVVFVLSLVLAMTLQQVDSAASRSRLLAEQAEFAVDSLSIEQEIAFRALVETLASRTELLDETEVTYLTRTPSEWATQGESRPWAGYFGLPLPDTLTGGTYEVRIQDSRGLLDLNYANPDYLEFLARIFGIPAARRPQSARALAEHISDRKAAQSKVSADPDFDPEPPGLLSPDEVCLLPDWSETDPCKQLPDLHFNFTAASGSLLNFDLAPDALKAQLLPNGLSATGFQATMAWSRVQQDHGFYDDFLGFGGQNMDFVVSIRQGSNRLHRRFRFLVGLGLHDRPIRLVEDTREPVTTRPAANAPN